ncbi:MFS transporter, partial [Bacillus subtilis]|nr:MFS transporter [Bacillus subtilis]
FSLGSLLCANAQTLTQLVAFRIVQGVGGAMLLPVGRLAVLRTFPAERYLPALSFVAIPGLIGPLIGPTLGGWLTDSYNWRWVFFINVPIGIYGIYLASKHIANTHEPDPGPLDWFGFLLSASGAALLLMGLTLIDGSLTSRSNAILM